MQNRKYLATSPDKHKLSNNERSERFRTWRKHVEPKRGQNKLDTNKTIIKIEKWERTFALASSFPTQRVGPRAQCNLMSLPATCKVNYVIVDRPMNDVCVGRRGSRDVTRLVYTPLPLQLTVLWCGVVALTKFLPDRTEHVGKKFKVSIQGYTASNRISVLQYFLHGESG